MTGKDRTNKGSGAFPESKGSKPARVQSQNQPDGTAADRPRGDTQTESAQFNKGLADPGPGEKKNKKPEQQAAGKIDPSSPTNSTEGGTTSMPRNPTMDSAGEVGEPSGKGTINVKEKTMNNQGNKDQGNKDNKDFNQGQQTSQQNKQGGQQNMQADQNRQGSQQSQGSQGNQSSQGSQGNQSQGNQQNMSGRSDRQESGSSQSGNQSGSQSDQNRGQQSSGQSGSSFNQQQNKSAQSSPDKKESGKSSEHMDEDNNQGDRKAS
jgi:hypothetical protein